ncbi:MAG TPA: TIGR04282 family arsenosugar biosynthesis glycosyltransferase [Patescibacteria group bacterium]|nr:TIGR04282 family arsenosugar biosynthesis glycosyltransferase [Patescibacteria group bacterium]
MNNYLIIFAKYPREGSVKTRLAKTLGLKKATEIYRLCAEHTFRVAEKNGESTIYLYYPDEQNSEDVRCWTNDRFYYKVQHNGELGKRMSEAFREVFTTKPLKKDAKNVVIIGTDAPDISDEILHEAFKSLAEHDIVIGPAHDGGYYLLGMKKLHEELFKNIAWSTESVFERTVKIAQQSKLSVAVLKTLRDIDTEEDLRSWLEDPETHVLKTSIHEIVK